MTARIYRPAKTAMQSGKRGTRQWVLVFDEESPREIEPLMGYTSSRDTKQQLRLRFDTLEEAEHYARSAGIAYTVQPAHDSPAKRVSYSDNFRFDRRSPWTH
ncbi:MAG TPA: ETC complex I subunit [Devosiaceae bacterium]